MSQFLAMPQKMDGQFLKKNKTIYNEQDRNMWLGKKMHHHNHHNHLQSPNDLILGIIILFSGKTNQKKNDTTNQSSTLETTQDLASITIDCW